jgi:hypothetical protein
LPVGWQWRVFATSWAEASLEWCSQAATAKGEYLAGEVGDHLIRRIGNRFSREGLLAEALEPDDVCRALSAMNYGLRHARGEGDETRA